MKNIRSLLIMLLVLPVLSACAAAEADVCTQTAQEPTIVTLTDRNGQRHCYACRRIGPPGFEVREGDCWQVVVDDLNR